MISPGPLSLRYDAFPLSEKVCKQASQVNDSFSPKLSLSKADASWDSQISLMHSNILNLFFSKPGCARITNSHYILGQNCPSPGPLGPWTIQVDAVYISHGLLMNSSLSLTVVLVGAILVNRKTTAHCETQKEEGQFSIFYPPKVSRSVSQLCIPGVTESNIHHQVRKGRDPTVIPQQGLLMLLFLSIRESTLTPNRKIV